MQVPVITTGVLPAISFSPQFLADALAIGSTLRLIDGISPGLVTDPAVENYCVLMPCRCVAEDAACQHGWPRFSDKSPRKGAARDVRTASEGS